VKHELTKHVGLDYFYVWSTVQNKIIALQYVPSEIIALQYFSFTYKLMLPFVHIAHWAFGIDVLPFYLSLTGVT
jgi:hypothetical protein